MGNDNTLTGDEIVRIENISCSNPAGEILFTNLNLTIRKGQNLLVVGPSGCGMICFYSF